MKIKNMKKSKYMKISFIVEASFSVISTILIPLISFFFSLESLSGKNIIRIRNIVALSLSIGATICILIVLKHLQPLYSNWWFIFSNLSIAFYGLDVYIWSRIAFIKVNVGGLAVSIDFTLFYLIILIIPFLLFIRNIYDFYIGRKGFIYKTLILKSIWIGRNNNSKSQIKKFIKNNFIIEDKKMDYLLRNFSKFFKDLESKKYSLIIKKKGYQLTKAGLSYLRKFESSKVIKHSYLRPEELDVWSEEELLKLRNNRG